MPRTPDGSWGALVHFLQTLYIKPERTTSKRGIPPREGDDDGFFRVLSYNVNFGLHGASEAGQLILNAVVESDADVVLLQETQKTFERVFREHLTARFPYQIWRDVQAAGGSAILSRFPLKGAHTLDHSSEVDGSWFETVIVEIDLDQLEGKDGQFPRKAAFANVHLRPPVEEGGTADLGTLGRTSRIRQEELSRILHYVSSTAELSELPLFIAGDFNEPEWCAALKFLLSHEHFSDAVEQHIHHSVETHRWPLGPFTMKNRLDHIVFDRRLFECVDCTVVPGYAEGASDHQPVLSVFSPKRDENADANAEDSV